MAEDPGKGVRHTLPAERGNPWMSVRRASEVRLVLDDDDGHGWKEGADFLEQTPLVLERISTRFRGIEEKEDRVREVGEGRDSLPLEAISFLHRTIEKARRVEHLESMARALHMAQRHLLRGEGIVRDLGSARGHGTPQGALPDVRRSRDDDRRQVGVDLRESPEGSAGIG